MEFNSINQEEPTQEKRPTFLSVLCVLSFVAIGSSFLGNFSALFAGPLSSDELEKVMAESFKMVAAFQDAGNTSISETFEMAVRTQQYINANFYAHTLITILSLVCGFIGVLFMFQGKKNGFHFYIVYNLISILLIYASVPFAEVPSILIISNTILSAFFVLMYSRNLHWMKN